MRDHAARKQHDTVSLIIVLLACATGLTVPITISIILILRARGVCCAPAAAKHHRIDQPPTGKNATQTAADGTPAQTPGADDRALYDLPEGDERTSSPLDATAGTVEPSALPPASAP